MACNVAGSAGTCSNIPAGQDPVNECTGILSCNGAGACTTRGAGALSAGENCDDGNITAGDGCDATCACDPSVTFTTGPGLNTAIADAGYTDAISSMACVPITVREQCAITSVSVRLAMTHTWIGDLVVKLMHPDTTVMTLMSRPGLPEPADTAGTAGGDNSDINKVYPVSFQVGAGRQERRDVAVGHGGEEAVHDVGGAVGHVAGGAGAGASSSGSPLGTGPWTGGDGLRVELTWDRGPTDLDPHLVNAVDGDVPLGPAVNCCAITCLPGSPGPRWDPASPRHAGGNPTIEHDSITTGPEAVSVSAPWQAATSWRSTPLTTGAPSPSARGSPRALPATPSPMWPRRWIRVRRGAPASSPGTRAVKPAD